MNSGKIPGLEYNNKNTVAEIEYFSTVLRKIQVVNDQEHYRYSELADWSLGIGWYMRNVTGRMYSSVADRVEKVLSISEAIRWFERRYTLQQCNVGHGVRCVTYQQCGTWSEMWDTSAMWDKAWDVGHWSSAVWDMASLCAVTLIPRVHATPPLCQWLS